MGTPTPAPSPPPPFPASFWFLEAGPPCSSSALGRTRERSVLYRDRARQRRLRPANSRRGPLPAIVAPGLLRPPPAGALSRGAASEPGPRPARPCPSRQEPAAAAVSPPLWRHHSGTGRYRGESATQARGVPTVLPCQLLYHCYLQPIASTNILAATSRAFRYRQPIASTIRAPHPLSENPGRGRCLCDRP